MTLIDPEQERRRLAEFYSGQMDGELEKVVALGDATTATQSGKMTKRETMKYRAQRNQTRSFSNPL